MKKNFMFVCIALILAMTLIVSCDNSSKTPSKGGTAFVFDEASFKSAIELEKNVILFDDIALSESIIINGSKNIIINLNNHTVSAPERPFIIYNANVTFNGPGVITETENDRYAAIHVEGSNTDKENYTVVTVGEKVTLKGWSGIFIAKDIGGTYNNYGVVVNLAGKVIVPAEESHVPGHGIYINGQNKNIEGNVPIINLNGASIKSTGTGIYAAGYAKWNLNNSEITAPDALSIKAGTFVIDGGKYTSTGTFADPSEDTSNGSVETGAALSMTSNNGYAHKINVTVEGGKFISSNGYAVYEGIPNNKGTSTPVATQSYVSLKITGGEFVGNSGKGAIKLSKINDKKTVSGGTFSSNPKEYLAAGFNAISDNGKFKVVAE